MPAVYDPTLTTLKNCPIIDELNGIIEALSSSGNTESTKDVTILIDDVCDFSSERQHMLSLQDLISHINNLFGHPSLRFFDTHRPSNLCRFDIRK